jgi:hypothetical protein
MCSARSILNTLFAFLAASAIQFFTELHTFMTNFYDKLTHDVRLRLLSNSKSEQTEYKATLLDTENKA